MDEFGKTDEAAAVPATPGFRFMGQSLGGLLELKASLRRRLGYLEQNRAGISSFVYEKLRQEYSSYLDTVDSELSLNLCEYEIKLAEVRLFSSQLQILRKNHSDNIEEIKLRYRIGEYGEEEYQRLIHDHQERMERFEEGLARYSSQEQKIRAFLEQVEEQPEKPSAPPAPSAPEPVIGQSEESAPELEHGTDPMPEVIFRFEEEPVIEPEVALPAPEDKTILEGPVRGSQDSPDEERQPVEIAAPASSLPERSNSGESVQTGAADFSALMNEEEVQAPPESPESGRGSAMDFEDAFSTGAENPQPSVEEDSLLGGMERTAGDIFAAMMEETGREQQSVRGADVPLTLEPPEAPAAEPVHRETAPETMMDALERDLAGVGWDAPGPAQALAGYPGGGHPGLDLEELMSVTGIPGPAEMTEEQAAAEPPAVETGRDTELSAEQPEREMEPSSDPEPPASPRLFEEGEEAAELSWEPLVRDHEGPVAEPPGPAEEKITDGQDEAVRGPLPLDGKIELTLDLDRAELDPRRILSLNQTIDAIKKKTVRCPGCGTMNYAIRWYCENCEATLTTL